MLIAIIVTLAIIRLQYQTDIVDSGDIRNWVSLVIEIGIGLIITLIILVYSDSQQKRSEIQQDKIAELILKVEKIQSEQHHREIKRKQSFGADALSYLKAIKSYHEILRLWLVDYLNKDTEESKDNIILSAKRNGETIEHFFVPHIIRDMKEIDELLDDPKLASQIIAQSQSFAIMFKDVQDKSRWQKDEILTEIVKIDSQIEMLSSDIERLEREITKNRLISLFPKMFSVYPARELFSIL